jgi:uncharacterized membrane protein
MIMNWVQKRLGSLSMAGLIVGAVFFALSLTPSLLPRPPLIQGFLSGCIFAVGYAIGAILEWIWSYLELKLPERRLGRWIKSAAALFCAILVVVSLYQSSGWQDSVRTAMGMEPVASGNPIVVLCVALVPAVILIYFGTLLTHWVQSVSRRLAKYVPPRVAGLGGLIIVGIVTAFLFSGVLLRGALYAADALFLQLDTVAGQFGEPPTNPLRSGSADSLVAWSTIGRGGRIYVETATSKSDIETLTGEPAVEPLRTYVGLRSAATPEDRAQLALAEMKRIGAFDRSVLVIAMPVGTGWVDPPSIDALEYLLRGDVASVAVQYSYLTSPLSLLVEPDYGTGTAQALFEAVYSYWTTLPRDGRPKLYLNGLSLGAHASQASTQFFDVMADPFDGALWVGPPFSSSIWRWATHNRQPDSPAWRPLFGDSSSIRFASRGSDLAKPGTTWGPMRLAFLQYASDPIVFFDFAYLYRQPDWMIGERGHDVPASLTWYPVVTFLQLAMDMALSNASPVGYGHVYSATDYIDSWMAIVEPMGWSEADLAALAVILEKKAALLR